MFLSIVNSIAKINKQNKYVSFYCNFLTFRITERGKRTAFVKLNNFNRRNGVP